MAAHLTQLRLFKENIFQEKRNFMSPIGPVSGQCKACRLAASDSWSQFLVGALPHNGQALTGVEGSLGDALLSIPQFQLPAEPQ